jgi:maleate isomerase
MPARPEGRRIGLLLPSSNTIQEPEFTRIMPDRVSLHVARLTLRTAEPEADHPESDDIETESRKLVDAGVDAIMLAATAPSSRDGIGSDQDLIRRIEAAAGKPATTASTAIIQSLTALGITRLAVAAPWTEATTATVTAFIGTSGFTVVAHSAMGLVDYHQIGLLDEETAVKAAIAVDHQDAQAVMLAGGNVPTLGIVDRLEATIGKPVLTTNQVSLWAVLRLAGYHAPVFGWGRLLREHMV